MRNRPAPPRAIDAKFFMLITLHFALPFSIIYLMHRIQRLGIYHTEPSARRALPTAYVVVVTSQWVELPTARQTGRKNSEIVPP